MEITKQVTPTSDFQILEIEIYKVSKSLARISID